MKKVLCIPFGIQRTNKPWYHLYLSLPCGKNLSECSKTPSFCYGNTRCLLHTAKSRLQCIAHEMNSRQYSTAILHPPIALCKFFVPLLASDQRICYLVEPIISPEIPLVNIFFEHFSQYFGVFRMLNEFTALLKQNITRDRTLRTHIRRSRRIPRQ